MPHKNPANRCFEAQLARLKFVAQVKTQCQLADFLGVRQASISESLRRKSIPASWLVALMRKLRVNPDWILEGAMPVFLCETEERFFERCRICRASNVLSRIPLEELQNEILRRSGKPQ